MTMQNELGPEKKFVCSVLPWLVAAAALVIYLLTLNHWISFSNMDNAARIAGGSWAPEFYGPLYYIVTFPLRWLPAARVPIALNLFSTVCAVLTLALLVRSVALLPHDRTGPQRQRVNNAFSLLTMPQSWIPPVLAALVCGLQLTFWERATAASNEMAHLRIFGSDEMFTLLLFAYVVRNLLEFRISRNDSWLLRAALVWGAATANSWAIFCLFPGFIVAIIWLKRLEFFNVRFLAKMLAGGSAGLLLYLLLPLIQVLSDNPEVSFWQALKANLAFDKSAFVYFVAQVPMNIRVLMVVTSFLPVLVLSIRWASNFGDPSRFGHALATWAFHLAHGTLFLACLWVAFDPVFSPRHKGFAFPILYYLGALSIGYFSGYFLLVFTPVENRFRPPPVWQTWLHRLAHAAVWTLLFVVPAGLVYRSLPQIRMTNGPALRHYAALLAQGLPAEGVVLSDDSRKLFLAEAWFARAGGTDKHFFLDTQLLPSPGYHVFQQKHHAEGWPALVNVKGVDRVDDLTLVTLQARLAEKHRIYYLHPSFGYYFEIFYPEPHGLTFELKMYPTNSVSRPPLTGAAIDENEKFWKTNRSFLDELVSFINPRPRGTNVTLAQRLFNRMHLPYETNLTALALGAFCSQALDTWGVEIQRAGRLPEAQRHFETALALNGDNIAARSNLELNRDLQAGRKPILRTPKSLDDELGRYRTWQQALRETGPFDGPTQCFGQAILLAQGNLLREATQQFERVNALVPENLLVRLWLARLYVLNRLPAKASELLTGLNVPDEDWEAAGIRKLDLIQTQATALFASEKTLEAEQLLQETMRQNPTDTNLLAMVVQISAAFGRFTNALSAVDLQLRLNPDDLSALANKGILSIQLKNFRDALEPLSRVLSIDTTNYSARLTRAYAAVSCDQFDEAEQDYELLRKYFPNAIEVNSGLAEIAWRKKDTNTAIYYYQLCLTNSNPNPQQVKFLSERLKSLTAPSP